MKLSEWKTGSSPNRSNVDLLPEEIRSQIIEARVNGTHSTSSMVAWLQSEGYTNVSIGSLNWYFRTRDIKLGNRHA